MTHVLEKLTAAPEAGETVYLELKATGLEAGDLGAPAVQVEDISIFGECREHHTLRPVPLDRLFRATEVA